MKPSEKRFCLYPLLFLILIITIPVQAEATERSTSLTVEGAYSPADNWGYGVSDGDFAPISYDPVENTSFSSLPDQGRDLGSTWGSAKIQALLTHRLVLPFLAGSGPLTTGNNVALSPTGALSPVSLRLEAQATLTPIAFLNVFAGVMLGTGQWAS